MNKKLMAYMLSAGILMTSINVGFAGEIKSANAVGDSTYINKSIDSNKFNEDVYINSDFGFSLKIPPIWKNNVKLFETADDKGNIKLQVNFQFAPDVDGSDIKTDICRIFVVEKDYYDSIKDDKDNNLGSKIGENEKYVYLLGDTQPNIYGDSALGKQYEAMTDALNGIDDLFRLNTQSFDVANKDNVLINNRNIFLYKSLYTNENGALMVPISPISKELGYDVTWNEADKTVTLTKNESLPLTIKIGSDASVIKDGITFVPVDYLINNMDLELNVVDGVLNINQ